MPITPLRRSSVLGCETLDGCSLAVYAWLDQWPPLLLFVMSVRASVVQLCTFLLLAWWLNRLGVRQAGSAGQGAAQLARNLPGAVLSSYAIQIALIGLLLMAGLNWNWNPSEYRTMMLAQNANYFIAFAILGDAALIPVLVFSIAAVPLSTDVRLLPPGRKVYLAGFLAVLAVATAALLLSGQPESAEGLPAMVQQLWEPRQDPRVVLIWALWVVTVVPIVEEYLFRGVLQDVVRQTSGPLVAIGLQAIVFTAIHASVDRALVTFGIGVMLGVLVHVGRSLAPAILAHSAINVVSLMR